MNEDDMDELMQRAGIAPAANFEEMCARLGAGAMTDAIDGISGMGDLSDN